MAHEDLDVLLTRMGAIAEAVNAFTSEAVQHEAFSALMAAFEGKGYEAPRQTRATPLSEQPRADKASEETSRREERASRSARTKRPASGSRSDWKMVKELNLNPESKQSFTDFAGEKNPRSNEDKYPVIVYYLAQCQFHLRRLPRHSRPGARAR